MSAGKQSARDIRWGRRGGRWAEGGPVALALDEIQAVRLPLIRKGEWPDHARTEWDALGDQAREHKTAGRPMEPLLERALEIAEARP